MVIIMLREENDLVCATGPSTRYRSLRDRPTAYRECVDNVGMC